MGAIPESITPIFANDPTQGLWIPALASLCRNDSGQSVGTGGSLASFGELRLN
jgi:hypothetical protein